MSDNTKISEIDWSSIKDEIEDVPQLDFSLSDGKLTKKATKPKAKQQNAGIKSAPSMTVNCGTAKVIGQQGIYSGCFVGYYNNSPYVVTPSGKKFSIPSCRIVARVNGGVALIGFDSHGIFIKCEGDSVVTAAAKFTNLRQFRNYDSAADLVEIANQLAQCADYEAAEPIFKDIHGRLSKNSYFNTLLYCRTDDATAWAELLPNGCVVCYLVTGGVFKVIYQTKIKSNVCGKMIINRGFATEDLTEISILNDGKPLEISIHAEHKFYVTGGVVDSEEKWKTRYVGTSFCILSYILARSNGKQSVDSYCFDGEVLYFKEDAHPGDMRKLNAKEKRVPKQVVDRDPVVKNYRGNRRGGKSTRGQ